MAAGEGHSTPPEGDEARADDDASQPKHLRVVGIGASAGGLEAIRDLLRHVPFDDMAFVVVQHLAPDHDSALAEILGRSSKIDVVTAAENMQLEANRVYVIPPNVELALLHGVLHLMRPQRSHGARTSVDFFFRTLAADQGAAAIGIVLSGTGSDGTIGLAEIKAAGGITFVQEPGSAKYDSMPRSALATGSADFCLTPQAIGDELARISRVPLSVQMARSGTTLALPRDELDKLFILIRSEFGNDLAHYKPATIGRRIERRMRLHKIDRLDAYLKLVSTNVDELRALYKDMLISVTHFFRDTDSFESLTATVLPRIIAHKSAGSVIRAWVPACATGEETYSIAICMLEALDAAGLDVSIQVFGSDLDEDAIVVARRGVYGQNIALDVSPERLARFFTKKDDEYQICRRVRDAVVFSKHNVLKDAPFSRIDFVSCRNLLIYLEPAAQRNVLRLLHYALNLSPVGFLMLGSSESVGDEKLFSLLDRRTKIYLKKPLASLAGLDARFGVPSGATRLPNPTGSRSAVLGLQAAFDRKVLELYGPAGVVVDENLDILQFRGRTGPFLDPVPGVASLNILRVARIELHVELKLALEQAQTTQDRVTSEVTFHVDGEPRLVRIDVVPILDNDSHTRCYAVLFQTMPRPTLAPPEPGDPSTSEPMASLNRRVLELERELAVTREYLQSTLEDKESTTEELKSSNEELQSSNEELQSTNEELETSKEEMQSANEELTTVNEELQLRMGELGQTTDDLHNLLSGLDNAVIIASLELRLRRYTTAAERLFSLIPGDVGRPLGYLDSFFGRATLADRAAKVIETLATTEEELRAMNQRWYAVRISPYRTLDHSIRGVVITVTDVDLRKRSADMLRDVGTYAQSFLAAIATPLLIVDDRLRIVWANEPFLTRFELSNEEVVGNRLPELGAQNWGDAAMRAGIEAAASTGRVFRDVPLGVPSQAPGHEIMRVSGNRIPASDDIALVLLSIQDDRGGTP